MADDVPIKPEMADWTEAQVMAYFESGGEQEPEPLAVLYKLSGKLIGGGVLSMSSFAGKPCLIMNVASR